MTSLYFPHFTCCKDKFRNYSNNNGANARLLGRLRSTYFRVRRGIIRLINTQEKFWIKHILDHATKFHEAIRLQVVQGNIIQRWNLEKPEKNDTKVKQVSLRTDLSLKPFIFWLIIKEIITTPYLTVHSCKNNMLDYTHVSFHGKRTGLYCITLMSSVKTTPHICTQWTSH